jgi:hypothetical protein
MKTLFAGVAVVLVLLTGCGDGSSVSRETGAVPEATVFEQVQSDCVVPATSLGDDGYTLVIDHKGEDDVVGVDYGTVLCVLDALDTPTSVRAQMDSTRALDGMRSGSWGDFTAVWSYHPDSGVNLIIEEVQ